MQPPSQIAQISAADSDDMTRTGPAHIGGIFRPDGALAKRIPAAASTVSNDAVDLASRSRNRAADTLARIGRQVCEARW
jgi:hypothetical protein